MTFDKSFQKQSTLVKVLLLLPFIGWITEILVRLSMYARKKTSTQLVVLIVFFIFGIGLSIVDLFFVLFTDHMIFEE